MPVFSYQTIEKPCEGTYKEKGSKFLAFAYPVQSEGEIKERLNDLRKIYFDARHHCYAWILGPEKKIFRAADDGEPNHSAGDPIIGQIRSKNLTDVLVVVVRYFGGVKLGVGGLVSAYKTSAEAALNDAVIITKEVFHTFQIQYDYPVTPDVMKLVKEFELKILEQDFQSRCFMRGEVPLREKEKLSAKVKLMNALSIPVVLTFDQ
ncbi:IMPACT family protein [Pseudochryseolinea flava]|uniref:YigZ family protein n=1 Tax=Pseudochryseolinea flava TaxID=2059302 RepID=A0A364Y022_9BACT|nr:YigZ family protein [Pseudochryseolinea flava]RAV99078.1 YigZ family protein [Pseudochryseolinea flava]